MKRGHLVNLLRSRGGASAVEFALVLTPLMLLSFGVLEFGRLFWAYEALQQTAITGARCMGIRSGSCAAGASYNSGNTTSYIQQVASGWGLTVPSGNITLNATATCGGVSGLSQVQLTYNFTTIVPQILPIPAGETLSATACFPNNP